MTAGQMLIYQKDMLQMGELTEVKNIRHETEFMMKDFRNRNSGFLSRRITHSL